MRREVVRKIIAQIVILTMILSLLSGVGPIASASSGLTATGIATATTQEELNAQGEQLVNLFLGTGITATEVNLQGNPQAFGTFTGGAASIGFENGIILSTGKAIDVVGPNNKGDHGTQHSTTKVDTDLKSLDIFKNLNTFDPAILEFKFTPDGDKISFQYVFASEEYNEYANDQYNDAFAFFVNGTNVAVLPGTDTPVSINTVNGGKNLGSGAQNPEYFINNDSTRTDQLDTQMDGLTVVMSVNVTVIPNQENTIKIIIADGYDASYDSNVFLKAGSFNNRPAMPGVLELDSISDKVVTIKRTDGSDNHISATWTAKDGNGNVITPNGTGVVSFNDGQESSTFVVPNDTVTIELSNPIGGATIATHSEVIYLAPIAPTIEISPNTPADQVVVSIATLAGDIEYSLDNGETWLPYVEPFTVEQNVTVMAKAVIDDVSSTVSTKTISNILEKSDAPALMGITANGTSAQVIVANVPAGATVIVYDDQGIEIGRGTNSSAQAGSVTIEELVEMAIDVEIQVSLLEHDKSESAKVAVTPVFEQSAAPSAEQLTANATTDIVTVTNVPAGTTVKVYNEGSSTVIGTATNSGSSAVSIDVTIASGLGDGQEVEVTFTEPRKRESNGTVVEAEYDISVAPLSANITANGTAATLTVTNVPAGATAIVYDDQGSEIGRGTNSGAQAGSVTIDELVEMVIGLDVQVSLLESNKAESAKVAVTPVFEQSAAPTVQQLTANATTDRVTVTNVLTGAIVNVYHPISGVLIGTATNNEATIATVVVTIASGLSDGQEVEVTFIELRKIESNETAVEAVYDVSEAPIVQQLAANATKDTVTVTNVPAGTIVNIYSVEGDLIGRATNNESTSSTVVVSIEDGLADGQEVEVTFTEPRKRESNGTTVEAVYEISVAPEPSNITAQGTAAQVIVANVPAGATVIVYDDQGIEIGRGTNSGAQAGSVTIEELVEMAIDVEIQVSLLEYDKSESAKVAVTPVFERSAAPTAEQLTANATTDIVTVTNVPAGTTVNVYDEANGTVIGTAINSGSTVASVEITIASGLGDGQEVEVTFTEPRQRESYATEKTAVYDLTEWNLDADAIVANATKNEIIVPEVPAGASITVRDSNGTIIGTAVNEGATTATVVVDQLNPAMNDKATVEITVKIDNYAESDPRSVTVNRQSASIDSSDINVDILSGRAVVANVPAGAKIILYDGDNVVGQAVNTGNVSGQVVIEGIIGYQEGEYLGFSITRETELESDKTVVELALTEAQALDEAARLLNVEYTPGDTWESVTGSLFLLTVGAYDTNVSWKSSKSTIIEIPELANHKLTAKVNRQEKEESVILTATIEKNGNLKEKTFLIIVKAIGAVKEEDTTIVRNVQVVDQAEGSVAIPILRINVNNEQGETTSKIDKVIMDSSQTEEIVRNAAETGNAATIVIDELEGNPADEFAVEVTSDSLKQLADNQFALHIKSEYAMISLSQEILEAMDDRHLDLFFRLIPIKQSGEQMDVRQRLPRYYESKQVTMLGTPLEIETNYRDFHTTLFIPFAKSNIDVKKVNLNMLRVYIEHSDGEKVMREGTLVRDEQGNAIGLSIDISKFSTFTIVELKQPTVISDTDDVIEAPIEELEEEIHSHTAYIKGYTDGTFRPNNNITRAELAALIARNLGDAPAGQAGIVFQDIAANHWATEYIEKAAAFGLIIGDKNGNYRPDSLITRAEMAMIGARFKQLLDGTKPEKSAYYIDTNDHWAMQAIDELNKANIMYGYEDGTFKPANFLTRAEAVTTLNRLFGRGPLYGAKATLWSDVDSTFWAYAHIAEASIDHKYINHAEGGELLVNEE